MKAIYFAIVALLAFLAGVITYDFRNPSTAEASGGGGGGVSSTAPTFVGPVAVSGTAGVTGMTITGGGTTPALVVVGGASSANGIDASASNSGTAGVFSGLTGSSKAITATSTSATTFTATNSGGGSVAAISGTVAITGATAISGGTTGVGALTVAGFATGANSNGIVINDANGTTTAARFLLLINALGNSIGGSAAKITASGANGDALTLNNDSSGNGAALKIVSDASSPTAAPIVMTVQDAAPSGPNVVGAMYMHTGGVLKVCTAAGSPGTWTNVGAQ